MSYSRLLITHLILPILPILQKFHFIRYTMLCDFPKKVIIQIALGFGLYSEYYLHIWLFI